MKCDFEKGDDGCFCIRPGCGNIQPNCASPETANATCRGEPLAGDRVKSFIEAVGYRKKKKCKRCDWRRRMLNRASVWVRSWFSA